jgi:hypothetical protein
MRILFIKFLFLFFFTLSSIASYANDIVFEQIPTGPYGRGSSIAVLFTPSGAYSIGTTTFSLYLSDADGNFNSSNANTPIGTAQTHYTTFINGLIPLNASASSNYRLKISAVDASGVVPSVNSISNFTINIQAFNGTNGDANTQKFTEPADNNSLISYNINTALSLYGRCNATNNDVYVVNKTTSSVILSVKNQFDNTSVAAYNNDPFATLNQNVLVSSGQKLKLSSSPQKVHYRIFQTITDANQSNTISTKACFFINNDLAAPFSALLNVVCYDIGSPGIFTFKTDIDNTKIGSAFFNYPGNTYTAKWDDNSANYVTSIQDIINKSGLLIHAYSESSCGKNVIASGQTIYNSFGPSMTIAQIATCSQTQEALTPIQIFPKPKISYTGPTKGCLGAPITFTNTSIISPQGSKTVSGCTTPDVLFYWFVDGVQASISKDFTTSNLTLGNHTIQLAPYINSSISCTPDPYQTDVCIEAAPPSNAAKFALIDAGNIRDADTTICPSNTPFLVVNKSSTLTSGTYCSELNYNWKLTGPVGFTEINSVGTAAQPNFTIPRLTIKGDYTLTLTVSNPCGTSLAYPRKITVLEAPSITSQPVNKSICDGNSTSFSAIAAGSNLTYQWQVSTDNGATFNNITNGSIYGGATTATLTLTGATVSMNGYKFKLIVSGTCPPPAVSNIVLLTVNPRPTSVIAGSTTLCANTPTQISIALTGTAPWSITYSDGTTPTTVTASASPYTFNVTLGSSKTYTVTVLSDANCTANIGDKTGSAVITVNQLPIISGTLSACVGATTQLTGSATADATTPWSSASIGVATISNTGLVTGISGGTSVITYKNSNGCLTTSTVTIYALPTVTIPTTPQSLCKTPATPSGTLLTSNTTYGAGSSSLSYQWFSNTNNANTGGSPIATSTNYTPSNNTTGETYYYLTVTNNNGCAATSNVSGIIKVYSQPTISTLTNASYCKDAVATALNPTFNNGGYGTLTYQWYSNNTNSTTNASPIQNETNATYTPPTNVVGTKYYYVIANNGGPSSGSNCNALTSSFAEIKVYAAPTIPTDPIGATYCATQTPAALTVPSASAGGNGSISYQWYSNNSATNAGGTAISGETGPTYTPPITVANTYYYYVTISNGA